MLNNHKIRNVIPYPKKKKMVYRTWFGLVLVMLIPLLTSCWNKTELNELRITIATGVDINDNGWQVSFQTIIPSSMASNMGGASGASGQPGFHTFTVEAPTFGEARNLSQLELSRRNFVGHNKVIIIGQKAARSGISSIMDVYLRNTESRETVQILVTDGKADDLLRKLIPPEKLPGTSYKELLDNESTITSIFPKTSVYDFALKLNSDSSSIGVPVLSVSGENTQENIKKLESMDVLKETAPRLKVKLTKLAIFKKDRLVGWLNREESLGLSWLTNSINQTQISFKCPDNENTTNSLRVTSSSTKLKPLIINGTLVMSGKIKVGGVLDNYLCKDKLTIPQTINDLNKDVADQILKDIHKTWSKLKHLNADPAGFADKTHQKYPKEWKVLKQNWDYEYQKIELQIKVEVNIKHPGLIQNSLNQ